MDLLTRARTIGKQIADQVHERFHRVVESEPFLAFAAGVALSPARCSRPARLSPQATNADWPRVFAGVLLRVTRSNTPQRALEASGTLGEET